MLVRNSDVVFTEEFPLALIPRMHSLYNLIVRLRGRFLVRSYPVYG